MATCKRMKLNHCFTPYPKINSKWIKDLTIRPKIIKFLEENIGSKLLDTDLGNDVFNLTPKAKAKINKWDYIIVKSFHNKGNHQQNEKATH